MSLFERIQNKILIEQSTGSTGEQEKKQERTKGADYSAQSDEIGKKKKTKYQQLRDQRTKYNVLKNKKGEYVPSIQSAKAKIGERIRNITQPPNPKATRSNALNASPGRIRKLNKAQRRAARFEPGAGVKDGKDYRTRILDRITKNQEANIDTSRKGLVQRTQARIDAKSPTVTSRVTGKQIPMPGAPNEVDFKTGGRGINQKGVRTDQAVINRLMGSRDSDKGLDQSGKVSKNEINRARRQQAAYDKAVKDLKSKAKVDQPVLGSKSFNLQTQYDDLKINLGGKTRRKRYKNQPTLAQVKADINKKYPVKMGKTGLIPDKSSGAYGSADDLVAVSADGKTRIKHPEYEKMKKDARKIKKKYTKINTNTGTGGGFSGSGGQKSFSIPKTKPASRFSRVLKALKKNPKTALAAAAIGTGMSLFEAAVVTSLGMITAYQIPIPEIKPFITVILILLWVAAASALILLPAIFVTLEKMGISAGSESNIMARKLGLIVDKKADVDVLDAVITTDVKDAW